MAEDVDEELGGDGGDGGGRGLGGAGRAEDEGVAGRPSCGACRDGVCVEEGGLVEVVVVDVGEGAGVEAVAAGESALHPSIARKVLERFSVGATSTPPEDELSLRELEVLRVAATGRTNKEIARDLDISPRTVQVHLANIFSKLGVGSRTEAVLHGIKRGWIDPKTL